MSRAGEQLACEILRRLEEMRLNVQPPAKDEPQSKHLIFVGSPEEQFELFSWKELLGR